MDDFTETELLSSSREKNVKYGCRKDIVQSPGSLNCIGCSCFREQHSPCSDRDVIFFVAALY